MSKIKIKGTSGRKQVFIKPSKDEAISIQVLSALHSSQYGLLKPTHFLNGQLCFRNFFGETLRNYLAAGISKNEVIRILEQFLLTIHQAEAIKINPDFVILNLDYIFYDLEIRQIQMLYLETESEGTENKLGCFLYDVINAFSTTNASDLDFRRKFIEFLGTMEYPDLCRVEDFLLREKKTLVQEIRDEYFSNTGIHQIEAPRTAQSLNGTPAQTLQEQTFYDDNEPTIFTSEGIDDEQTAFGAYEQEDDDEPTCFMSENGGIRGDNSSFGTSDEKTEFYQNNFSQDVHYNGSNDPSYSRLKSAFLIQTRDNEKIYMTKPVFRIGRENGKVDFCVLNNKNVSRAHVDFISRAGNYYVMDLASKNRTYVNDRAIPANVEIELHNGDHIKLCDEEFIFYLPEM